MTIDEAIKHCEDVATEKKKEAEGFRVYGEYFVNPSQPNNEVVKICYECARDHEQLAEWLKDYKRLLEMPKGDLISREALREDLRRFFPAEVIEGIEPKTLFAQIMHDIDNAPTVEPCYQTTSCLDCKNYDKENYNCPRFCEVIKEAIKSRPQGEWKVDGGLIACNKCGHILLNASELYNFCGNCGAKMIGGKENE